MPNQFFEPIIGSSFDALAGQRAGWAGFNRAVDEGNLARAAAAQQNWNNWLDRAATIRNAADIQNARFAWADEQAAQYSAERQREIAEQRAEAERQRNWSSAENALRIAEDQRRIASAEKIADANLKLKQEAFAENLDQSGTANAAAYAAAQSRSDSIQKQINSMRGKIADAEEKRQVELGKKKQDFVLLSSLNSDIKALNLQLPRMESEKSKADAQLAALHSRILNEGFNLNPDSGEITHPTSKKAWSFRTAIEDAAAESASGNTGQGNGEGSGLLSPFFVGPVATLIAASQAPPQMWRGFDKAAETNAPAPLPATNTPVTVAPKKITLEEARAILSEVGGDKERARALAKQRGYVW